MLPAGTTLYSLGPIHHRFLYWYRDPLPIVPMPAADGDALPEAVEFFAVTSAGGRPVVLPFDWTQIARINVDRSIRERPVDTVVVGRRL